MKKKFLLLLLCLLCIPGVVLAYSSSSIDYTMNVVVIELFFDAVILLAARSTLKRAPFKKGKVYLFLIILEIIKSFIAYALFKDNPSSSITFNIVALIGFMVPLTIIVAAQEMNREVMRNEIKPTVEQQENAALILRPPYGGYPRCEYCNTVLSIYDKNCIGCGKENFYYQALTCPRCRHIITSEQNFCTSCGYKVLTTDRDIVAGKVVSSTPTAAPVYVDASNFDSIFNLSETELVKEAISREFTKVGLENSNKLIPKRALTRKRILFTIFSILLMLLVTLRFFHINNFIYLAMGVTLVLFMILATRYNMKADLVKQARQRPNEKISNIVLNNKNDLVNDSSIITLLIGVFIAIIAPCIVFFTPKAFYEPVDGGYALRFYTYGIINNSEVVIPEKHQGKDVVGIRGSVFEGHKKVEKITLPDTIKEIRGRAFKDATNLKEINMPKSLETLGGSAFYNCTSLRKIEFYDNVKTIGGETFYNNINLTEVKLSESLTEIKGRTFQACKALDTLVIPNSVTKIGGSAFKDSAIREVVLSENLEEIEGGAFQGAYSLEKVDLPGKLVTIGGEAFANCKNLKEVTMQDSVTYLGGQAFQYDSSLTKVVLSKKLTEIRGNTFEECSSLETIEIPDSVMRIGGHAFTDDSMLREVTFTENSKLTEIGSSAFRRCYSLNEITLQSRLPIDINTRAFKESPTYIKYFGTESQYAKVDQSIDLDTEINVMFDKKYAIRNTNLLVEVSKDAYNVNINVNGQTVSFRKSQAANSIHYKYGSYIIHLTKTGYSTVNPLFSMTVDTGSTSSYCEHSVKVEITVNQSILVMNETGKSYSISMVSPNYISNKNYSYDFKLVDNNNNTTETFKLSSSNPSKTFTDININATKFRHEDTKIQVCV